MRYGPPMQCTLQNETERAISICERLDRLNPVPGSVRIDDAEAIVRAQSLIAERVAGETAESILHPDYPSPGAQYDFTEAGAIGGVGCAAGSSLVVAALLHDAEAEAAALITDTIDIVCTWVAAIAEHGTEQ